MKTAISAPPADLPEVVLVLLVPKPDYKFVSAEFSLTLPRSHPLWSHPVPDDAWNSPPRHYDLIPHAGDFRTFPVDFENPEKSAYFVKFLVSFTDIGHQTPAGVLIRSDNSSLVIIRNGKPLGTGRNISPENIAALMRELFSHGWECDDPNFQHLKT